MQGGRKLNDTSLKIAKNHFVKVITLHLSPFFHPLTLPGPPTGLEGFYAIGSVYELIIHLFFINFMNLDKLILDEVTNTELDLFQNNLLKMVL